MFNFFKNRKKKVGRSGEIFPDEIFLDAYNQPAFNRFQLQGRMERPIKERTIYTLGATFILLFLLMGAKIWFLQIKNGEVFALQSRDNSLRETTLFPARGLIEDRRGRTLVSNENSPDNPDFPDRIYTKTPGFSGLLGYISYPKKDGSGFYTSSGLVGRDGVEKLFDGFLAGQPGARLLETDALGKVQSSSVILPPHDGNNLKISVDSEVQEKFYEIIKELAGRVDFKGGAGVIMDVRNGELLASVNFPEYDSGILTDGKNTGAIDAYRADPRKPFLNRVTEGLYAPGSIIKPFLASAALEEKVISPEKEILSTGSIFIPNPYDSSKKSVFNDWRAHGLVDMRKALAVSSDVYFYEIGGGFENQPGLGIGRIEKYLKIFGFGAPVSGELGSEAAGVIPNPAWKAENFNGEIWRVGDTYNTAIGQYGLQATPLQAVRAVAAVANGGNLLEPRFTLATGEIRGEPLPIEEKNLTVVREGMREAVLTGTAAGLNTNFVEVAAKTGTAELGSRKQFVNSWVIGFFPYKHPRFAFAVVMEKGPAKNLTGGAYVMRTLLDWMGENTPEYLEQVSTKETAKKPGNSN